MHDHIQCGALILADPRMQCGALILADPRMTNSGLTVRHDAPMDGAAKPGFDAAISSRKENAMRCENYVAPFDRPARKARSASRMARLGGIGVIACVAAVAACLLPPTTASAAGAHGKRPLHRPGQGYGFLPGYQPPEIVEWERARTRRPTFWYGPPGFYRGRWNGGGFGPCWTPTPIGPHWNCG
jgi:hypothetical protein